MNAQSFKRLSRDQAAGFQRDGILSPIRAITAAEAGLRLAELEQIEAARAGRLPPSLNAKPHLLIPSLWDLVLDARIVDPVEDILGPDLLCLGTSFISKAPRDGRYVSWHQDTTHWGLDAPEAVTAWLALTPSVAGNGCLKVVPGSHSAQRRHDNPPDRLNMLGRKERLSEAVDANAVINVELAPGEMSLHHPLVVHSSEPNQSQQRRTGFAIRYIPGHVGLAGQHRNSATLVRGRNHDQFDLEQAPEGQFHPDAMMRHKQVLRRSMEVIFDGARPGP